MTLKELKQAAKNCNLTVSKKDGEYRVNFANGREESAYYTTDIDDAYATMQGMAKEQPSGELRTNTYLIQTHSGVEVKVWAVQWDCVNECIAFYGTAHDPRVIVCEVAKTDVNYVHNLTTGTVAWGS